MNNEYIIQELLTDCYVNGSRHFRFITLYTGKKFMLQSKDIVFVPPTEIVKWNRTISLLLPQTDLFNSYNPIIQSGIKDGSNTNLTEQFFVKDKKYHKQNLNNWNMKRKIKK